MDPVGRSHLTCPPHNVHVVREYPGEIQKERMKIRLKLVQNIEPGRPRLSFVLSRRLEGTSATLLVLDPHSGLRLIRSAGLGCRVGDHGVVQRNH